MQDAGKLIARPACVIAKGLCVLIKRVTQPPFRVKMIRKKRISPNVMRVWLGEGDITRFPAGMVGGYFKLRLPPKDGETKPIVRTYSVRQQSAEAIAVDFALHVAENGAIGPATSWALSCEVGQEVELGGRPGPAQTLPSTHDYFILVGDMTALPAISVNLETLRPETNGVAILEVLDEADIQQFTLPDGFRIDWLINPHPGSKQVLPDAIRSLDWPNGNVFAWVACEFGSMRNIREYLRNGRSLTNDDLYISSYWKHGSNEDMHRKVKTADSISERDR